MRSLLLIFLVLIPTIQLSLFDRPSAAQTAPTVRPGAVLVRFRDDVHPAQRSAAVSAYDAIETPARLPFGVREWVVEPGREIEMSRLIAADPAVLYAEPDYRASALAIPHDPYWSKQWSLAQIGAPAAWDVITRTAVTVAVIDSGTNLTHPDLSANLWANAGEVPNNRVDDDGNGKIDDVNGWRFHHRYTSTGYVAEEDARIADDYGHGTHVAGVIGAAANNGIGIAGLAWSAPLMTVKVLDQYGNGWYSDIAAGIMYAVDNGAKVINLSAGAAQPSVALCDAAAYAYGKGALLVGAAGNAGEHSLYYPAACEYVLSAGATDQEGAHASFSNDGPGLDLSAPGVDIYSTWYATGTQLSTYFARSGTSQAAAHVSGAAALVWARWPGFSSDQVAAQLKGSATDIGAPGWDPLTGWGGLDAARAVGAAVQPADLQLQVSGAPDPVFAGQPYTVTFAVNNAGPGEAGTVTLNANLPAGSAPVVDTVDAPAWTCSLNDRQVQCGSPLVRAGSSAAIRISLRPWGTPHGMLHTSASLAAAQNDPAGGNNTATLTGLVAASLAGYVFLDPNGDGVRQPWEMAGLADAGLWLERDGQPVAYATSLAPDGAYRFYEIHPGQYDLFAGVPPEYGLSSSQPAKLTILQDASTAVDFGVRRATDPLVTVTPSPTASLTPTPTPTTPVEASATPSATRSSGGRQFLPLLWQS